MRQNEKNRHNLQDLESNSSLSRDVTSVLSVQMVVKGKWQGKLLLQNIYMYTIVTLEVVYDHVGKCRKLVLHSIVLLYVEMKFQAKSHVIET